MARNHHLEALEERIVALEEEARHHQVNAVIEKRRMEDEMGRLRNDLLKAEELLKNRERTLNPTMISYEPWGQPGKTAPVAPPAQVRSSSIHKSLKPRQSPPTSGPTLSTDYLEDSAYLALLLPVIKTLLRDVRASRVDKVAADLRYKVSMESVRELMKELLREVDDMCLPAKVAEAVDQASTQQRQLARMDSAMRRSAVAAEDINITNLNQLRDILQLSLDQVQRLQGLNPAAHLEAEELVAEAFAAYSVASQAKAPASGIYSTRPSSKTARSEVFTPTVNPEAAGTSASDIYSTTAPAGTAPSSRPSSHASGQSSQHAAASLTNEVATPMSGEQAAAEDGVVEAPEEAVAGISSASNEPLLQVQQDEAMSVHSSHAGANPKDNMNPPSVDQLVRQLQSRSVPDQQTAAAALRGRFLTVDEIIIVAGAIPSLVQLLDSSSAAVQENAAALLTTLCPFTDTNKEVKVAAAGAIPSLVQLLSSTSADVQEQVAQVLAHLSVNDDNKVKVAAAGAIPPLIQLLRSSSADVQQKAAAALAILSVNDDNEVKVAAAGAIPPLIHMLASSSAAVQEGATHALVNLSCNDDNQVKVAAAGAIPPLVQLLSSSSIAVQKNAELALAYLSHNADNRVKVAAAGAIPPLVQLLGSSSVAVQCNAAYALATLSINDDNSVKIAAAGADPALMLLLASSSAARTLKCM